MRTPRRLPPIAATTAGIMLATSAAAQCPPQRIDPTSDFAWAFGVRLAANERHLIIGDRRDHTLCGDVFCANGYAWAYQKDAAGDWVLTQRIEPADLGWSWGFGRAIALDGDRAIITRTLGFDCEMLFEFEFDGERWVEVGPICVPPMTGVVGTGVELLGDMLLVYTLGGVQVYHDDGAGWSLVEYLSNPDSPGVESFFGSGIDLDDQWVVIGASVERTIAVNGGAVYVYRRLPEGGVEFAQKLVAHDVRRQPRFGESVALQGTTLVVGGDVATRDFQAQGAVYIYELIDGQWEFQQDVTHADPERADRLGTSVDVRGDLLLAGAISDRTPTSIGAAYLFRRGPDGAWSQTAQLVPELSAVDMGVDVTLLADQAIVGSENSVHVFDLACNNCPPDLDADGSLTIFDFLLFFNAFDAGDPIADFDGDGEFTIFDFLAYQTAFDAGC